MATAQWFLILCVLTGTVYLAQGDLQSIGVGLYSDCLASGSQLTVTNVTLNNTSPRPTDNIYLNITVNNSATANITVEYLIWTVNFTNPISVNQTLNGTNGVVVNIGANSTFQSNNFQLNQFYANGSIPFQVVLNSSSTMEVACWTGSVNVLAPTPNPSDCLNGNSSLSVTNVTLNASSSQTNNTLNLTFTVQNLLGTNVTFDDINLTLSFNTSSSVTYNLTFDSSVTMANGTSLTLTGNNVTLNQSVGAGTYPYQFAFYSNNINTEVACWTGNVTVFPPPPKPIDCFEGQSQLNVSSVTLNPIDPQITDKIYLTFEVETESSDNVTFNNITWTLALNSSSPIISNFSVPDITLTRRETKDVTGNSVALNQSVSPGEYPYQLTFYENSTEIACWGGNITVTQPTPTSSSYITFLGVAGLSILFMS